MSDASREIANLLYSYAERIDAGDFGGVADLLAHAEISTEGVEGVVRGREAVLDMYRTTTRIYEETGTPRTQHVITNLLIDVEEARNAATCRSRYTVLQQTPTLTLQPIIAGRYHDRFERAEGVWRFAGRRMFCDLFGNLSQHLLFDPATIDGS